MKNDVSLSTVMRLESERGSRVGSHVCVWLLLRNVLKLNCPIQEVAGRKDFRNAAEMAGCNPVQIRPPTFPYRFIVNKISCCFVWV